MSLNGPWEELRADQGREIAGWLRHIEEEYRMNPTLLLRCRYHPQGGLFYEIEYSAARMFPDGAKKGHVEARAVWPSVRHKTLWGAVYAACVHLSAMCDEYRGKHKP